MITLDGKRLIINNATYADSGEYTCKVKVDGFGTSPSETVLFWVGTKPKIVRHKAGYLLRAPRGQKLKFPCRATGIPPPKIAWYYMGEKYGLDILEAKNDSDFRVYGDGSLEMLHFRADMTFEFVCMARNVIGEDHINVDLSTPVKISVDEEVRAIDGRNLIVPCKVLGSPKTDAIWMDKKRIYVGNGGRISSRKNGNLEVDGVLLGDRGRYYCTSARDDPSQDRLGGVWLNVYGMYVRCSAPLMKRNVYDETSYSIYTTLH
ncbi:Neuroglian [Stylophora pistillata]|uniref:Neuroglian n=1 Tax=Stylophora pistillata TaxID=50429 RepID=A0A2B4RVH5_STYPI|nr:Neuroglian [Stylophora pistillata]